MKTWKKFIGARNGASAIAIAAAFAVGGVASAQVEEVSSDEDSAQTDVIVVEGYRRSLAAALDVKRNSVGAVDAIVAEDIAKFPDQNLAESLQRIPGVAITRDSGEGRAITVRGLSGEFTRVRVNGMEAIAATGGEGSVNRGREFDFNVFASELFSNIVVRKTASASLDEGSLGAVVDLNTGRAFQYPEGTTFAVNAQGQYNELNEDLGPRVAGLFAYNNPNGLFGFTLSAAYSDNTTTEFGQNTVRWQRARFNTVEGQSCTATPEPEACAEVANAFHPRIPRYGEIEVARERIGLTAGAQMQLTDRTLLTIDGLYSKLNASRSEIWGEVLFRGNEGGMDVVDYTFDPATNNVTSMLVNNAWVRNENFEKAWETKFFQVGAALEHEFSDFFRIRGFYGVAESDTDFPHEITFMYDDRDYDGYLYDYTDDQFPTLAFNGPDVTDPTNFQLTELRDRLSRADHAFDNATFDAEWDLSDQFSIETGFSYKKFAFDTWEARRDTGVCGAGLFDCDLDDDGTDDLVGVPATADRSIIYEYPDVQGDGSTASWAIPSLDAWIDYFDLFNLPASPNQGNIRSVEEKNLGAYIQFNGDVPLGQMDLRFDLGLRYVRTNQESTGFNSGVQVTVDRPSYDDWLPSGNIALSVTPELIWRVSGARVMTRPSLGNLSPGGSVDSFNYRVNFQNPFLDPSRATALDTSLEWYFDDESLLSFAFFYKDIASRPIRESRMGTYASTGLPLDLLVPTSPTAENPEGGPLESCNPANGGGGCWEISEIINGDGGSLYGFEVGGQMPLSSLSDNLPPVIEGLGFIGNFTWVKSEVDYFEGEIRERLFGLSEKSFNATIYYADDVFDARLSAAYRDEYLTGTRDGDFEGYDGTFNLDFSASYAITDNLDLSFEALNLTDDYQDRFIDRSIRRRYEYDHTGRVFIVGARFAL